MIGLKGLSSGPSEGGPLGELFGDVGPALVEPTDGAVEVSPLGQGGHPVPAGRSEMGRTDTATSRRVPPAPL